MKTLETEFESKGFRYTQVRRDGDVAIYKQSRIDGALVNGSHMHGSHSAFEVVKIRRHNGYTLAGISFPPAEMYPSSSLWGLFGWTCVTLEEAEQKFQKLQQQ